MLESNKAAIESATLLPASKALMKAALLEVLRNPAHVSRRKALKKAYELLSSYQNLSDAEAAAMNLLAVTSRPRSGSQEEYDAVIAFMPVAVAYENLQKRVDAERVELALELLTAGVI